MHWNADSLRLDEILIGFGSAYHQGMRVRELAEWLGATFEGDGEKELTAVAALESAGAGDVAFVRHSESGAAAQTSAAGCLIVPEEWPSPPTGP